MGASALKSSGGDTKDFERQTAAEAMDRHEAELTKLQEETLKAALGPAKK